MFPWQLLITGVVGVGGTALGAWLNGRMQTKTLRLSLSAETERARLAEKRRLYAAFNATINRLLTIVYYLDEMATSQKDSNTESVNVDLANAESKMHEVAAEAVLIAPANVRELIRTIAMDISHYQIHDNQGRKSLMDAVELRSKSQELQQAMRADLGETD